MLIDPHLLVWALAWPSKLPPKARQRIESSEIFASAASIWKIGIKSALGKLSVDPAGVLSVIEPAGFDLLYITGEHAAHVAWLPHLHKVPFDRLLVAQAWVERMILLTDDESMGGTGALSRSYSTGLSCLSPVIAAEREGAQRRSSHPEPGKWLAAAKMKNGVVIRSEEGTAQGGAI